MKNTTSPPFEVDVFNKFLATPMRHILLIEAVKASSSIKSQLISLDKIPIIFLKMLLPIIATSVAFSTCLISF